MNDCEVGEDYFMESDDFEDFYKESTQLDLIKAQILDMRDPKRNVMITFSCKVRRIKKEIIN